MFILAMLSLALVPATVCAFPSVYPTGTTIYKPEKTWSGYTVYRSYARKSTVLIDMNGNIVKEWKGIEGFPSKLLPGGYVMGSTGAAAIKMASRMRRILSRWIGMETLSGSGKRLK